MTTFRNMLLGSLVSIAIAGPATASPAIFAALPELAALSTDMGRWAAEEWRGLRKVLLTVSRAVQAERNAAIRVVEGSRRTSNAAELDLRALVAPR